MALNFRVLALLLRLKVIDEERGPSHAVQLERRDIQARSLWDSIRSG